MFIVDLVFDVVSQVLIFVFTGLLGIPLELLSQAILGSRG